VGQDREARARHARRSVAAIDASIAELDPKWRAAFDRDVARDAAFERSLLAREWAILVVIFFLVLVLRLFR
jgi:hypothetical protein